MNTIEKTTLSLEELIYLINRHPDVMSSEIWTKDELMSRVEDEIEDSYSPKSLIDSSVDEQVEQITDRIWIEKERQLSENIPNEYHDAWLQIVQNWLDQHHQEFNLQKLEE
jgi:hypothetical protein